MRDINMSEEQVNSPETVAFHYLKSPDFKTLFAHGAVISGTTRGEVIVTPYVERTPIPTQTIHELVEVSEEEGVKRGKIGKQVDQVARDGIVREFDISLILPAAVAEDIAKLLTEKAQEARKLAERANLD